MSTAAPRRGHAGITKEVAKDVTEDIDEGSDRWFTAVHEAGHIVIAEYFGGQVISARIDPHDDGVGEVRLRRDLTSRMRCAVVAVAGDRATRLLCGGGGNSRSDYRDAAAAVRDAGHDERWGIERAEDHADSLLAVHRRDVLREARTLYRRGRR